MYDAFISYSHSDCGTIAPAIQKAIENIGKPWYQLKRNLNVFRDETNLGANPHLWENIEKALQDSDNFILLASPKACESDWVTKEIEKWAEKDPKLQKFNIVVTSGEIYWDKNSNDFDWEKTTCLPKCLKSKFQSEPLYIDLKDYINKNNRPIDYKSSGFTYKIVKIISAITGIEPREIESDEKKRRNNTIFALTIGVITFVSISILGYMFYQQKEINERNAIANNLIAEGNRFRGININKALLFYAYAYENNKDSSTFQKLKNFYNENNLTLEADSYRGRPARLKLNLFGSKCIAMLSNFSKYRYLSCEVNGRLLTILKDDKTILTTVYLSDEFSNIYDNEIIPSISNFIISKNGYYAYITLEYSHYYHSLIIDLKNNNIIRIFQEETGKFETGFQINPETVYFDTGNRYYLVGYENGSFQKIFFNQYDSDFKVYNFVDLNSQDNYTFPVTATCSNKNFIFIGYSDGAFATYKNDEARYSDNSNGNFLQLIKRVKLKDCKENNNCEIQNIQLNDKTNTVFITYNDNEVYKIELNKQLNLKNINSKKIIDELSVEDLSSEIKKKYKIE